MPWLLLLCHDFFFCAVTFSFVPWLFLLCRGFCFCAVAFVFVPWLLFLCRGFCLRAVAFVCVPWLLFVCHGLFVCMWHLWATVLFTHRTLQWCVCTKILGNFLNLNLLYSSKMRSLLTESLHAVIRFLRLLTSPTFLFLRAMFLLRIKRSIFGVIKGLSLP